MKLKRCLTENKLCDQIILHYIIWRVNYYQVVKNGHPVPEYKVTKIQKYIIQYMLDIYSHRKVRKHSIACLSLDNFRKICLLLIDFLLFD